jgi:hypothetical protein
MGRGLNISDLTSTGVSRFPNPGTLARAEMMEGARWLIQKQWPD